MFRLNAPVVIRVKVLGLDVSRMTLSTTVYAAFPGSSPADPARFLQGRSLGTSQSKLFTTSKNSEVLGESPSSRANDSITLVVGAAAS